MSLRQDLRLLVDIVRDWRSIWTFFKAVRTVDEGTAAEIHVLYERVRACEECAGPGLCETHSADFQALQSRIEEDYAA